MDYLLVQGNIREFILPRHIEEGLKRQQQQLSGKWAHIYGKGTHISNIIQKKAAGLIQKKAAGLKEETNLLNRTDKRMATLISSSSSFSSSFHCHIFTFGNSLMVELRWNEIGHVVS
ncbi:hypothetical protein AXF42_Ash018531 [Apostasia shenzhenica]|uniref:Uncharacterized protein n=1 Tax=Apostasia shenzhenica TaxID=1088818 RepID=A0A2I0AQ11_9ASPA|nr:hypothetical protein AXF42_Ash018531 [Apostasia shenzhenica]